MLRLNFVFVFAACCLATSHGSSGRATTLGLGMTLPSSHESQFSSTVPEFLRSMSGCWSSGHFSPQDCVPISRTLSKSVMDDVNIVRALRGTARERTALLRYSFNISTMQDKLQYLYIRVTKEALSMEESASVQKRCNTRYGVPLTLTMLTHPDVAPTSTVESTIILKPNDMEEKMVVNFTGFTLAFNELLKYGAGKPNNRVSFRLRVSGSCHSLLSPAHLGFISSGESHPWIVAFSDVAMAMTRSRLSELTKQASNTHYIKRQTEDIGDEKGKTYTADSESPCRMYTQKVFFSELGWGDRILRPDSFDINYCLGICHFPQISSPKYNTTKHSHIQSIAAHYNPDYVPTPCCVPHEYSDVEILYEELSGMFVKYVLTDVAVKSCGCK